MQMTQLEEALRHDLSNYPVTLYRVTQFCKSANINRGMFYRQFKNLGEVYALTMEYKLKNILSDQKYSNFGSRLLVLMNEIKENSDYYANIFYLMRNECICSRLTEAIYESIKVYASKNGPYAKTSLNRAADAIYFALYHWIAHQCKEEMHAVYQSLFFNIKLIEDQKRMAEPIEWPL